MRIERIDVTGFGCLRNTVVDFRSPVTVIVGVNESGKSTLQRALRAALYGLDSGGPGRAVERSDWARWTPWDSGSYGVSLTYTLDDGRRLRVARNLDTRTQGVQVLEIGGSDLTDELRSGRAVTPGIFHLGIDEAVYCATAWLGDDGLRIDAPDGAQRRADRLQEAIERLADTRRGFTATQAIARLREAMERVGSERRGGSELGAATLRVRELESKLGEARRRMAAIGAEQDRLRDLEAAAAAAALRLQACDRARLTARLADLVQRGRLLEHAGAEASGHAAALAETERFATFPLELEAVVTALGGELTQATLTAAETQARWETARQQQGPLRLRRAEIAAGLDALPATEPSDPRAAEQLGRLRGELADLERAARRSPGDPVADARFAGLRNEIAATGLRTVSIGSVDELLVLLSAARLRLWQTAARAAAMAVAGIAGTWLLVTHQQVVPAALLAAVAALAVIAGGRLDWQRVRLARAARRRLDAVAGEAGLGRSDLDRLAGRLPVLRALHAALAHEQAGLEGRRAEAEALEQSVSALIERCRELARACRLEPAPEPGAPAMPEPRLEQARAVLDAVETALSAERRREELQAEDDRLAAAERTHDLLAEQAQRASDAVTTLEARMEHALHRAGLPSQTSPAVAVESCSDAAEARRRHDAARLGLAETERRERAFGDRHVIRQLVAEVAEELRARGGDPADAGRTDPVDAASLRALDLESEHARQALQSLTEQVRELSGRLAGALDSLPDIADLDDEREACEATRQRCLGRLTALQLALELVEAAARGSHRDLAPQLAASMASRLSLLSDSRYVDVNVDTEHFAVALHSRERPEMIPLELASHGTRDQVSLLLRLAMCETLSASAEAIPLCLDEPLLTADPQRRRMLVEFLHRLSATHQVIMTTADPDVAQTMRSVAGDDCTVIELGGAKRDAVTPTVEVAGRHAARVRIV